MISTVGHFTYSIHFGDGEYIGIIFNLESVFHFIKIEFTKKHLIHEWLLRNIKESLYRSPLCTSKYIFHYYYVQQHIATNIVLNKYYILLECQDMAFERKETRNLRRTGRYHE